MKFTAREIQRIHKNFFMELTTEAISDFVKNRESYNIHEIHYNDFAIIPSDYLTNPDAKITYPVDFIVAAKPECCSFFYAIVEEPNNHDEVNKWFDEEMIDASKKN